MSARKILINSWLRLRCTVGCAMRDVTGRPCATYGTRLLAKTLLLIILGSTHWSTLRLRNRRFSRSLNRLGQIGCEAVAANRPLHPASAVSGPRRFEESA